MKTCTLPTVIDSHAVVVYNKPQTKKRAGQKNTFMVLL